MDSLYRGVSTRWNTYSLTLEQSEKAHMPPTNDANEGVLSTWCVWTRRLLCLALHRFNALMMRRGNKTETYMAESFTPEQHIWARAEARRIDSSKKEEIRKAKLVPAATTEAEKNQLMLSQRADR